MNSQSVALLPKVNRASLEEVLLIIGEVENSKQVHLGEGERASLQFDLYKLSETVVELRQRAEVVKRNVNYGKLSLDLWLSAGEVFTKMDVEFHAQDKINKRRARYIAIMNRPVSEEELAREGLIEVQSWWRGKIREAIDKHAERIDKKCRKLRAQFFKLPDLAKADLWAKAVERGVVTDGDKFVSLILPNLIPHMMEDFEEAIKNNSVSPEQIK